MRLQTSQVLIKNWKLYLDGDYGDYETALDMINVNHDETVDKVHKDIICMAVSKKKGLPG